jgi:hypothetical protein
VVSTIVDTDNDAFAVACMVHLSYAPCPHDGEPANELPLHVDTTDERAAVVEAWTIRTHRQRPLLIHQGDMTDGSHDTHGGCQCGPEVLAAVSRGD